MSNAIALVPEGKMVDASIIERVIAAGDISRLSPEDRTRYYVATCRSLGLNPLTRPFEFMSLNGKHVMYATKSCTDQLRSLHGVSVSSLRRETVDGVHVVTASVTSKDGRSDEDIGAVSTQGLRGEAYANAIMKATTKAKRRATLSICGLSFPDETEVETIPNAHRVTVTEDGEILDAPKRLAPVAEAKAFAELCERVDMAEGAASLNAIAKDAVKAAKSGAITDGNMQALKGAVTRKRGLLGAPAPKSEPKLDDASEHDAHEADYEAQATAGDS